MLRRIRSIAVVAAMGFVLTCIGIFAFALLHPATEPSEVSKSDIIVVLGAGMDPDGTLHRSTKLRVEAGVKLWKAKAAPRMHFTGGRAVADGPSAGQGMAALAHSLGVPEDVMTHEDRSLSTLQNAFYSQPMIQDAIHLRIVTEGFHLPRGWASFKWAAWHAGVVSPSITLTHSERLRTQSPSSNAPQVTMVLREAAALWFNLLRVTAFEFGTTVGVAQEETESWLD